MNQAVRRNIVRLLFCGLALSTCALATPPATDATSVVPVRTLQGYLMVVGVSMNGAGPFNFLVDTGTNTTLIDPQLAVELGLKPVDKISLTSLASAVSTSRYFLSLRVGPASVSHMEALAVPLPQLQALDRSIRGVLGMNFLLQFSFRLDYDQQRMEIFPDPRSAPVPDGLRVRVEINQSRLLVPVASKASPHGNWKLALDSGISQPLVFQNRLAMPAPDTFTCGQPNCLMQVSTNLADHAASTVLLRDLSIAGQQMEDTAVVVLRNDLLSPSDPQDGLLPAAHFSSVFFDRTSASVVFSPRMARQVAASAPTVTHPTQLH